MAVNNNGSGNARKVVTGVARLSYAHVWEPVVSTDESGNRKEKYSVSVLIPKTDTKTVQAINRAVDVAIEEGLSKFNGKRPNRNTIKLPLRDGDERDDEAYRGCWFVNANSTTRPEIVDRDVQPIIERGEVYSGCYARVSLTFYAFNSHGNRGVACGLGNIQKVSDGEPLGGHASAESEFTPYADNPSYDTNADPATGEMPLDGFPGPDDSWLS